MSEINPDIFKTYDIRGEYGKDLDEVFGFEFANKFCNALSVQHLVVGHDARPSSLLLNRYVIAGAKSAGVRITAIGTCTSPLYYFSVNALHADGGIMITASHLDDNFNGFKPVGRNAAVISGAELKSIYEQSRFLEKEHGIVKKKDMIAPYVKRILSLSEKRPLPHSLEIDSNMITEKILRKIGETYKFKIVKSHSRHLITDNGAEKKEEGFLAHFDADGDRITIFENGKKIDSDMIFLLLIEKLGFRNVLYDLRFSRSVTEHLNEWGVWGMRSKVGRSFFYRNIKKFNADFGGELSGHFYFKEFGGWEAPPYLLVKVLEIMEQEGKSLASLTESYRRYWRSDEMNVEIRNKRQGTGILTGLKRAYKDGNIDELDGLTVGYPDWWFNARLSNTESIMRLVVEARNEDFGKEKLQELSSAIKNRASQSRHSHS